MERRVKFSIITVTYNAARWLEETIRNVLSQSYRDIEYIVVDGGSTDGTPDIVRRYEADNIRWISEPDQGIYDAMNKGIGMATGDYLWFINAGDLLASPETAANIAALLPDLLPDIVYGETGIIDEKGRFRGLRRLRAPEKLTWKSFSMGMLVCHQSFLVRREMAPAYDLQYRFSSDFDWCICSLKRAGSVLNTHSVVSYFREGGTTTENHKRSLRERYRIMCRYYGTLPTMLRHLWFALRFYFSRCLKGRV